VNSWGIYHLFLVKGRAREIHGGVGNRGAGLAGNQRAVVHVNQLNVRVAKAGVVHASGSDAAVVCHRGDRYQRRFARQQQGVKGEWRRLDVERDVEVHAARHVKVLAAKEVGRRSDAHVLGVAVHGSRLVHGHRCASHHVAHDKFGRQLVAVALEAKANLHVGDDAKEEEEKGAATHVLYDSTVYL